LHFIITRINLYAHYSSQDEAILTLHEYNSESCKAHFFITDSAAPCLGKTMTVRFALSTSAYFTSTENKIEMG
jgi:hypothetical protein